MDPHAAIIAHVRWKVRLLTALETGAVPDRATACVDNRCDLGQWIHGDGARAHGEDGIFQRLRDRHADFHRCLGPIIDDIAGHHEEQARHRIANGEFPAHTEAVIDCLVDLLHRCPGSRP